MEHKLVLFIIGVDRPGIAAGVSEILYKEGCNIEDSSMSILERHFAMILIVSTGGNTGIKILREKFKTIEEKLGLSVTVKRLAEASELIEEMKNMKPYVATVIGKDRTGIVYRVTNLLAEKSVNILDVRTEVIGEKEEPVYTMIIELEIPKEVKISELKSDLKKLGRELDITISLKPIEVYNL